MFLAYTLLIFDTVEYTTSTKQHILSYHTMDIQSSIDSSQNALTLAKNSLSYLNATSAVESESKSESELTNQRAQKLRILTYLKQLKTIPLSKPSSKTIHISLANSQLREQSDNLLIENSSDLISKQLEIQLSLSNILDELSDSLLNLNTETESKLPSFKSLSNDDKLSLLLNKINSLKSNSRKLSSYIKILINDYLFSKEFSYLFTDYDHDSLKSKKQNFLKLLETLLNNNILNPNSSNPSWISLSSMDDPLVRFLILNRLIIVHPTSPNKIMLKDLSVDL